MMKKSTLVAHVINHAGLNSRQANECVASFVEQITNALARGEKVNLLGFGSFTLKHTAKREGRNPQTGEVLSIAAHNKVSFKAGEKFKRAVQLQQATQKGIDHE